MSMMTVGKIKFGAWKNKKRIQKSSHLKMIQISLNLFTRVQ